MDTVKILELLETTDPKKLAQLERVTKFTSTSAQTANEMLNDELFGSGTAKRVAAKESVQKQNKASEPRRSRPLTRGAVKPKSATESAGFRRANGYRSTEEPVKGAKECVKTPVGESGCDADKCAEDTTKSKRGIARRDAAECSKVPVGEAIIETGDSKFPEEFDFDAEAFAEEYGIDPETVTCIFVEEDPDAKIAEHVELSFTYEESKVILSIFADGAVTETVDAEEVDAQFSANFAEEEDEDGNKQTVLHVDLIDEEEEDAGTDTEDAPADDTAVGEALGRKLKKAINDSAVLSNMDQNEKKRIMTQLTKLLKKRRWISGRPLKIVLKWIFEDPWNKYMTREYEREIKKGTDPVLVMLDFVENYEFYDFLEGRDKKEVDVVKDAFDWFEKHGPEDDDDDDDADDDDDGAEEDIDDDVVTDGDITDSTTTDDTDESAEDIYKSIIRKLTEVPDVPEAEDELREELEKSGLTEEEMAAVYAIKDEAPDAVMSEGDIPHDDEDGARVTDEFIEEPGLNLDPVYSKDHDMKVAKGYDAGTMPGYRANESAARKSCKSAPCATESKKGATESLAAKIIRTSK